MLFISRAGFQKESFSSSMLVTRCIMEGWKKRYEFDFHNQDPQLLHEAFFPSGSVSSVETRYCVSYFLFTQWIDGNPDSFTEGFLQSTFPLGSCIHCTRYRKEIHFLVLPHEWMVIQTVFRKKTYNYWTTSCQKFTHLCNNTVSMANKLTFIGCVSPTNWVGGYTELLRVVQCQKATLWVWKKQALS